MKQFIISWILLFSINCTNFLQAQNDPFAPSANTQMDAAALSPSELPTFKEYMRAPENIKVTEVDPKTLSYALKDRNRVFLLDARTKEEFDISHIADARWIGYEDFSVERVWMVDRRARIVVYSANNKRAIVVAQYLKLLGFMDVELLEGGLIAWKNAEFPVVNTKGETDKVHVGNKDNAKLLKLGVVVF